MSLPNLSAAWQQMRMDLLDALLRAEMRRLSHAREKAARDRAEANLVLAWRRAKAAEAELDEIKNLLANAVVLRSVAAAEWLVAVGEGYALLASAIKKFAPDIADALAQRWNKASAESQKATEDFLAFLRGHTSHE